jgi:hypothetical protein
MYKLYYHEVLKGGRVRIEGGQNSTQGPDDPRPAHATSEEDGRRTETSSARETRGRGRARMAHIYNTAAASGEACGLSVAASQWPLGGYSEVILGGRGTINYQTMEPKSIMNVMATTSAKLAGEIVPTLPNMQVTDTCNETR